MNENPVNKAAGVVDAGAKGLWYLLDGALAAVEDRDLELDVEAMLAADDAPRRRQDAGGAVLLRVHPPAAGDGVDTPAARVP